MSKATLRLVPLAQELAQLQLEQLTNRFDGGSSTDYDQTMSTPTREEIDAKLETIEVRMDARVAAIQSSIDGFAGVMNERFKSIDERMGRFEGVMKDTQASIGNLKTTMVVTAISAVLAIVLGVAAFNATVLSNMVASFESGKNTTAAQGEVKRQSEETARLLRELDARMSQLRSVPPPQQSPPKT